jgi:hypothetical protein
MYRKSHGDCNVSRGSHNFSHKQFGKADEGDCISGVSAWRFGSLEKDAVSVHLYVEFCRCLVTNIEPSPSSLF